MSNTFKTNMKLFDSRPQIYPVNEFATPQKISPFTLPNVGRYGHGLFNQDKSILISLLLFTGFITIINTYGFTCERIYYWHFKINLFGIFVSLSSTTALLSLAAEEHHRDCNKLYFTHFATGALIIKRQGLLLAFHSHTIPVVLLGPMSKTEVLLVSGLKTQNCLWSNHCVSPAEAFHAAFSFAPSQPPDWSLNCPIKHRH